MATKILHLLRSDRFSGAENVVCQIMTAFSDREDLSMVYCSPDGPIRESLKDKGISFLPLASFSKKALKKALNAFRPDIIHAHDPAAAVLAARYAPKGIKIVSHVHGNHKNMRVLSLKTLLFRFYYRRFFHIFWVNHSALADYRFAASAADKSEVLLNIVDPAPILEAAKEDAEPYDIAYLGRLSRQKDPLRLMRVLAGIHKRLPDARFCVMGDGEMAEDTRKAAKDLGVAEKICFAGFTAHPLPTLARAKMMLMTSRFEGVPMCALEAMTLGVPIVSTPTDGLNELIDDGVNGFLAESDEALVERSVLILTDPVLQRELSENARACSDKWNDLNRYKERLLAVYE